MPLKYYNIRIMKQPDSLRYQCIKTLGTIVYKLCIVDISFPMTAPYTWLREQILLVPPNLVNEVVAQILFAIDQLAFDSYHYKEFPGQYMFLDEIIPTILHPDVTELIACLNNVSREKEWKYIVPFLCKHLFRLHKLKVIHFPAIFHQYDLVGIFLKHQLEFTEVYLPELEKFTYHGGCTDKLLGYITRFNIDLKHLDVQNSRFINNESVDCILRLPHLQYLNISRTFITQIGLNELANSDMAKHLKFLGISSIPDESFLENSKRMTQLQGLLLHSLDFSKVEQMIKNLGKQLIYLSLLEANSTLISVVREYCPTLRTLHIDNNVEHEYEIEEPGFLSIKELKLSASDGLETVKYILNNCINVESLELDIKHVEYTRLICEVLKKNPLLYLRKLYLTHHLSCGEVNEAELKKLIPSLGLLDISWNIQLM